MTVNWKYRKGFEGSYVSVSLPIGGCKSVHLDNNLIYTFDEINKKVIDTFAQNEHANCYLNSSLIEILTSSRAEDIYH